MASTNSSAPLPKIKDCPEGKILNCRFTYDPDYTPIVVFLICMLLIFMLPRLVRLACKFFFQTRHTRARDSDRDGRMPAGDKKNGEENITSKKRYWCCKRTMTSRISSASLNNREDTMRTATPKSIHMSSLRDIRASDKHLNLPTPSHSDFADNEESSEDIREPSSKARIAGGVSINPIVKLSIKRKDYQ